MHPYLCVRTAKTLVRLCGCDGSLEPALVAYAIRTKIPCTDSYMREAFYIDDIIISNCIVKPFISYKSDGH